MPRLAGADTGISRRKIPPPFCAGLPHDPAFLQRNRRQEDQSAAVIACASAGDFIRFTPTSMSCRGWLNRAEARMPQGAGIFLEISFDCPGRFVHIPILDLASLARYFRAAMFAFFLQRSLINERLAWSMLAWTHSGFSVDLSVKIPAPSSEARAGSRGRRAR
jgi:hypothetical protein